MKIFKTLSLAQAQLKTDGAEGHFTGYASVFDGVDSQGDTIKKGAFVEALKSGFPKMFFNHHWDMPIGRFTKCEEDNFGLFVEGQLTPGLALAKDVQAALLHGTLDGLSVGGFIKKGDYEKTQHGRLIRTWSVLSEISPCVFPADRNARIDLSSVKSLSPIIDIEQLSSMDDIEYLLRSIAGGNKELGQLIGNRIASHYAQINATKSMDVEAEDRILKRIKEMTS